MNSYPSGPEFIPHPREHLYFACSTICNLRCCFCPSRLRPLDQCVMTNALFASTVDQACEIGYKAFGLTPVVGEAFTDPEFVSKLSFLERHPMVSHYTLTTNFTLAGDAFIESVPALAKLRYLSISIYGHDPDTFALMTGASPLVWHRLIRNLQRLAAVLQSGQKRVQVRVRTRTAITPDVFSCELRQVLSALRNKNVAVDVPTNYYNWGGLITDDDLNDLGISLSAPDVERTGPCAMIFYKNIVLPDGRISACACRDAAGLLIIGDLTRHTLRRIYSRSNGRFRRLIEQQCAGHYGKFCASCNMFRSIYRMHSSYRHHTRPLVSLAQILDEFGAGSGAAVAT